VRFVIHTSSVTFVALWTECGYPSVLQPTFRERRPEIPGCQIRNAGTNMESTYSRDGAGDHIPSFAERLNQLSKKRRQLILPIHEHPSEYVLLPIRDVASKLKTDPATVLRIVRGLGFDSYRDFKSYLHELSIASATSLEGMRAHGDTGSSILSHGHKALEQDIRNLHALRNTLDMKRVASLAKRIHEARRILILGGDLAISLVYFLEYRLIVLGFPVSSATTPGISSNAARHCGKRDLIIAISFRRGLRQTVEALQQAHANGAHCVGITDTFVSPIARFADECFLMPVEAHLSNSYTAPISFINVLLTVCAHYRRSRTVRILKKVDQEQRYGFRWYRG
jgi:DNA-binding MurR/RpiR family transcriptional regulator